MNVTAPTTITLDNSYDYALTFSADGYQIEQVQITRVLRGMFWGNILFGGIIGGAVDAGTGAMWRLVPESITVTLTPLKPGEAPRQTSTQPLTLEERRAMMDRLRATNQITEEEYQASIKAIDKEMKMAGQGPR
ncbi:hypothetical protein [Leptolyngbya sp. 7M]|uniref:hypothetical protein n=1 Tax=Leptolyngbya sp. 7M TaxID=2812896 RepID=UPI001B8D2D2A|nr:hypothetical protein [Leptolyngbya sp. 7M]QYO64364.1 hypothetical protein JVX88_32500 [Leptolyngbya sp. 7M]